MKISLTEEEIGLKETTIIATETFEYTLNGVRVEGFSNRKDALKHAQYYFGEFISNKYLKKVDA